MRWNRRFNSQRAQCEEPSIFQPWFQRVAETISAYSITDDDTYNFDETGFMLGLITIAKVVTNTANIGRTIAQQLGNHQWITAIECICASGWAIAPFLVFPSKQHQSTWYNYLVCDSVIALSENGWTTNEIALEWIQHFNHLTECRTKCTYWLLVLDGHSSYVTPEFDQYCKDNHIIILYMPAHSSHLLQSLDVSCFGPLKKAYANEIYYLIRLGINHIDKLNFLKAY
jgi:DDE superfamily endonuclease